MAGGPGDHRQLPRAGRPDRDSRTFPRRTGGFSFDYVAAWITLNVHSALEAVGLTAAFATALGQAGISCNVIAGYYHDHLFVGQADAERAMHVLRDLAANAE
jgi:hypothetical protein